ncbi:MAG: penicillin acylase family protein, partial [Candidatus Cloacimonadaceae bacterium]|nr:penicillin acylase family protein [Candidatus Cloacimonadaceae bacterium]
MSSHASLRMQSNPEEFFASLLGGMSKSGSNAFAISPRKSATGGAIMASDPHLGINLPNMWLLAGYQSPSYHVVGLMFPGLPVVLVGRNKDIAFSGTNMRAASSDLYELDSEQLQNLSTSKRKIAVRGWFDKKIVVRSSEIGPIISDAPLFNSNGRTIAMRWVGHEYSDELSSALKMNQASTWGEFTASFDTYAVSGQNYLYADAKGSIGLLPAVKIPVRDYHTPESVVHDMSENEGVWNGFLKTSDLPRIYNPESGFIASANNQPVKATTPLGFFFSSNDRVTRMNSYLADRQAITWEDIRFLHTDTYVGSAHQAAQAMARAMQDYFIEPHPKGFSEIQQMLE